ncbi:uncharacterized protein LOC132189163 [Corylus avellana]|uniref:uncharacterized protein LOC132189163 n=1 Tax=Corylus avellana TaxID=13451 RepID=UPI00286BBDDE|nr:uncharacterized protein LOC132189163 [Corylus avellana]XP_059459731.1 uncharacterized protein LOC132189163 [Corylus avellana]
MTAEVDARGIGEVPKVEVEEKCNPQRENNGVEMVNGNSASTKDDADGSYVFVSGSDAVSDGHVELSDLNGDGEHVENVGAGGVSELKVVENDGGLEGSDCGIKEGEGDGIKEENGAEAVVESEPQLLQVEQQIKGNVEESSGDAEEINISQPVVSGAAESELYESSTQVDDGKAEDNNSNSAAASEPLEIDGQEKKVEEEERKSDSSTDRKDNYEFHNIVNVDIQNDLDQEREPEMETNEVPVEGGAPGALVGDLEQNNQATTAPCPVNDTELEREFGNRGVVSDEKGDGSPASHAQDSPSETVDGHQKAVEQNGSSENAESLPSRFVCGNAAANEIPVEEDLREHEVDLEQTSKTASFQVADTQFETEVVPDENGDRLPTDHAQDGISENFFENDLVDSSQNTPEQNGSAQNVQCLPSPVACEGVPVESGKSFPSAPDNHTDDDAGNEASPITEFPTCVADDESPETEVGNLDAERSKSTDSCPADYTKLEIQVENSPDEAIKNENGPDETIKAEHGPDETIAGVNGPDETIGGKKGPDESIEGENGPDKTTDCANGPDETIKGENGPDETIEGENGPGETIKAENGPDETIEGENEPDKTIEGENGPDETIEGENGPDETIEGENGPDETIEGENGPGETVKAEHALDETIKAENGPDETIEGENGPDETIEGVNGPGETIKAENGPDETIECANGPDETIEGENGPDETIKAQNGPDYTNLSYHADDARSETEAGSVAIDSEEKVSDFSSVDAKIESGISNGVIDCADGQSHSVSATIVEPHVNGLVENESSTILGADVKSESEVENMPAPSSRDIPRDDGTESESKVPDASANLIESAVVSVPDAVDVEDGVDQFTGIDSGDKPTFQGTEGTAVVHGAETSITSPEDSTIDALEGPYFLIRIPRYDDGNIREQIKHAQLQVDEKTRSRDAIRAEIQMKRATWKEYGDNFEAAVSEEKAARNLLRSKRQEMDSAQSEINRVKNAISVEDIDVRIRNMEHAIQHETLPLREEKQLIREIKQLKQHREQISSTMGGQDDVQQALDQKGQIEERLKFLRKELDILRDNVLKAEAVTKAAKKKYNEESEKLNEIQARFKAADDIRQEAYAHLQSLRKQLYEKTKYFRKYKDDITAATDFASKGNREELQRLCVNQVGKVMELWNKDDEFRKEYIRCNTRSTLRRLRTLDGRSLGPDEEPPQIPYFVNDRVAKDNSLSLQSAVVQEKQNVQVEAEKVMEKPIAKAVEQKNEATKSKKPVKPAPLGNGLATISGRDEIKEAREEEHKLTKEEEELARKAEELRREEEAAKLREQQLLEEKAKAKEALERKKRNAEKAQARALLKAQREAEQKEKEREKKARKKEKKKVAAVEAIDGANEGESAPSSETTTETPSESETGEKPLLVTKRSQRPSQFIKPQTKAKAIPPPLRSRNKRRMQPWMWVLLAALVVFALFLVGNSGFSFDFGLLQWSGF